jgi:hypothetical protein
MENGCPPVRSAAESCQSTPGEREPVDGGCLEVAVSDSDGVDELDAVLSLCQVPAFVDD